MRKVQGGVQNYAWGRQGSLSWVSNFISPIIENSIYAEYWLGTHASLPTKLDSTPLSLITGELPYLFKVLSIAKPLSIQIHPNKIQAEKLHELNPAMYPDNNHKPEMCIAKNKMRMFIGFKTQQEINDLLEATPELLSIVGQADLPLQLHRLYENEAETRKKVEEYCNRVSDNVYSEVNQHFPNDPGVFFSMFMNYLELSGGESVIINPGVPHCYIEGECIEAMACSDNVVRAGLTPKAKDVNMKCFT